MVGQAPLGTTDRSLDSMAANAPPPRKTQWSGSDESAADAQNIAGGKDAGEKTANLGRLPDEMNPIVPTGSQ